MRWSVKESLLQYVRALGEISYDSAIVEQGNELAWPLVTDHHEPDGTRIAQYRGRIHLRAHDGLLDIVIADPQVRLTGVQGQLSVAASNERSERVVVATLDVTDNSASGVRAEVRVTTAGSMLFGSNCPSGKKLSPLTIGLAHRDRHRALFPACRRSLVNLDKSHTKATLDDFLGDVPISL
ncbi:HtaA domain-containing protein [Rhodococcus globerulus]|uniref:HtaA domain-containing protein n=1 Tax=Rhodococcus globerulus TaxID=33008 RepID=UPI002469356D|nr:HtaA domain-containing protein [Rhodococcus globerulus]